jgi:hypothetical protein
MTVFSSGVPSVPARGRARGISGTLLVRCIGAAIALPGLAVLSACLHALLAGITDVASALVGIVVGAQFAAIGAAIFYFAYLASPVSAERQADFRVRHGNQL